MRYDYHTYSRYMRRIKTENDEEVESIRYSYDFYHANTWLAGFISALMRSGQIVVSELSELLDYKSELLWKNFD